MVSRVIPVEDFDLVIFGGTGDLARRKILPGLFRRFCAGQMPAQARIIGAARSDLTDAAFRKDIKAALEEFLPADSYTPKSIKAFLERLHYVKIDATGTDGWAALKKLVRNDKETVQAFYFSVAPILFGSLAERLHTNKIAGPKARIVVEKPFGRDLESAKTLNTTLRTHFDESQIYR
ncbi:MAG: glucose-6-phosphate dehydrogenase, partial [Boseongicola sp.]|nr:glucose-6-phosphate dehydrogenase [Boseongicola sp.]